MNIQEGLRRDFIKLKPTLLNERYREKTEKLLNRIRNLIDSNLDSGQNLEKVNIGIIDTSILKDEEKELYIYYILLLFVSNYEFVEKSYVESLNKRLNAIFNQETILYFGFNSTIPIFSLSLTYNIDKKELFFRNFYGYGEYKGRFPYFKVLDEILSNNAGFSVKAQILKSICGEDVHSYKRFIDIYKSRGFEIYATKKSGDLEIIPIKKQF